MAQILIGDPKQLEAHSNFFSTHLPCANGGLREYLEFHSRSTMGRLTECPQSATELRLGGLNSSALHTQYRMHDHACRVVAKNFYRPECATG